MPPTPSSDTATGFAPARIWGTMYAITIARLPPVATKARKPLKRATTTVTTKNSASRASRAGRRTQSDTTKLVPPPGAGET